MNRAQRLELLDYAREQAYVTSLEHLAEGKLVAGTLGPVPVDPVWAAGGWPIPVLSQDDSTFSFVQEEDLCDPARATMGYSLSGKCPLIYSANPILVHGGCRQRRKITDAFEDKTVLLYEEGDACWEEKLTKALGTEISPAAWEKTKQESREIARLHKALRQFVKTKQCFVADWAVITDGIRFLPNRQNQKEMLQYFCEESAKNTPVNAFIPLAITDFHGADPTVYQILDQAPVGYEFRFVGCEHAGDDTVDCLHLGPSNCEKIESDILLSFRQMEAEDLARLKNIVHKGAKK